MKQLPQLFPETVLVSWEGGEGLLTIEKAPRLVRVEQAGDSYEMHITYLGLLERATLEERRRLRHGEQAFVPYEVILHHPALPTGSVAMRQGRSITPEQAVEQLRRLLPE